VLLSSHISMLRNPKFPTQSGRRNGWEWEKVMYVVLTRNNKL
jgi:hypothetical protein